MLTIGEFSSICQVSAKTLRYYAEIGLILPREVSPENGYRYYSIDQLKTMLLINRLKSYQFSLEEIKRILDAEERMDEMLYAALSRKKKEIREQERRLRNTWEQMEVDLKNLSQGKNIMSYLEEIDIQLVEVPKMCLLSIRKPVQEYEYPEEYSSCFGKILANIAQKKLTMAAPPMVLFHSKEYSPFGLDTEFAVPVQEFATGTRDFCPGLCLKTVVCGSYSQLPSVYAKQTEWAEKEGYVNSGPLYEVYVTDPGEASGENELITEVYYPVKKKAAKYQVEKSLSIEEKKAEGKSMDQQKINELEERIRNDYGNTTGLVVRKDGKLVYEKYFNGCTKENRVHVYSVTKSILSALIGIAADQGYIKSLDQKILEFFPEYLTEKGERAIQEVTLKDMLTMTAPWQYGPNPPYIEYFTSSDWVKFSLDLLGGEGERGRFQYAPLIGPDILSGILVKTTGQSVLAFAEKNLFSPLGITVKESIVFQDEEEQMAFQQATDRSGWVMDPKGIHTAGWGLTLSAEDMAKIGQLYVNDGVWEGRRILSESWIRESTREHSRWEEAGLSYGYLWWVDEDCFMAVGDGGNVIYADTKKHMVVAMNALLIPEAKDRIELIRKYILPAF